MVVAVDVLLILVSKELITLEHLSIKTTVISFSSLMYGFMDMQMQASSEQIVLQVYHALAFPLAKLLLVTHLISSGITSLLSLLFSLGLLTFLRHTGHFPVALPGSP